MRQNTRQDKQSLTPMQKQAVLVCIVCALAALLTIGITLTLIKRGKNPSKPTEQPGSEVKVEGEDDISDHYQINETSTALLTETADAGEDYQKETVFIGDSNTVRLYANGLISLQQFCAKEGIGTHAALNDGIVTFKRDDNRYTIAQAVAKMKPRRVVIMLGTNDTGMETADFIANYTALVQAIQESYPYTDIIVNTVPPVPANHSNYPNMDQTKIDDFNMALLSMCEQLGLKFLNSAEALKDANGYGNADYYQSGDIHLKPAGLKVLLNYLRTHAYETEDRRPDTSNIPTRAEYTANPSSAITAPSSSEDASSSEESTAVQYTANYRVDKTGGGTLSSDSASGKGSLSFDIIGAEQSVSVTAVPEDGYVFVKWSDGVTKKTRTDANFKQNLDVTAVFAAASVKISSEGKATVGGSCTFKAKLSGKYLEASSIRWYANGAEVTAAAGQTSVTVPITKEMQNATVKIYAVASYNDCRVTSNTLEVTVSGAPAASSSSSSSSSTSSSGASSESSSGTTSSGSASSSETSSSNGTASSSSHSSSTGTSSSASRGETASPPHSSTASRSEAVSSSHSSSAAASSGTSSSHSTSGAAVSGSSSSKNTEETGSGARSAASETDADHRPEHTETAVSSTS